jgi:hypothetical protein
MTNGGFASIFVNQTIVPDRQAGLPNIKQMFEDSEHHSDIFGVMDLTAVTTRHRSAWDPGISFICFLRNIPVPEITIWTKESSIILSTDDGLHSINRIDILYMRNVP